MKALKRFLSAALVVTMLLSCMGAAPGEADEQDGTPVQSAPVEEQMGEPADAPAESDPAPEGETTVPAEETTAPAEETTVPAEETTVPAEETTVPAEETTAPAEETSAPAEDTPAPKAAAKSLGSPKKISAPAPIAADAGSIEQSGVWTYGDSVSGTDVKNKFTIVDPDSGYGEAALEFAKAEAGPYDNNIPTDAGDYWVKATWTETAGSGSTVTAVAKFTIAAKAVTFTLNAGLTKTYIGKEIVLGNADLQNPTAGLITSDQSATITINTNVINAQSAAALTNAKVVIMRGDVDVTGNYIVTISGNLTVDKAALSGATVTFTNPVYDGTAQIPTAAVVKLGDVVVDAAEYDIVAGTKTATNVAETDGKAKVEAKTSAANVQGSVEAEYGIDALNLANATVELTDGGREYTGEPLTAPSVAVKFNGKTIPVSDYEVANPSDLTNAGEKTLMVTAKSDNCTGTNSAKYTVAPKSLTDATVVLKPEEFEYDGTEKKAAVIVKLDGKELAATDYEVSYGGDTINVGTVTVTVTGKGNYTDSSTPVTYEINPKDINSKDITVEIEDVIFNGAEQKLVPVIKDGEYALVAGKDFEIKAYSANVTNVGAVTVSVSGIGNYTGDINPIPGYDILPQSVKEGDSAYDSVLIELAESGAPFDGQPHEPQVTVSYMKGGKDGGTEAELTDQDYKVTFLRDGVETTDFTNAGTITVQVEGIGNFTGVDVSNTFSIGVKDIADSSVEVTKPADLVFNGVSQTPDDVEISDTVTGEKLVKGTDYELSFTSAVDQGEVTVTITGLGNYAGSTTETKYTIKPQNILEGEDDYRTVEINNPVPTDLVYDGAAHKWVPELIYTKAGEEAKLVDGTDYTVEYSTEDFTNVGKITVTITGIGNFTGNIVTTYEIAKKAVTVTADGEKLFGAVDPKLDPKLGILTEPNDSTEKNWIQVVVTGLVDPKDVDLLTIDAARVPGEAKELPGAYDIQVTVDATKATNYDVKVDDGKGDFTIKTEAAFTVSLGDTKKNDDITTHTVGGVDYAIAPVAGQTLIPDLQSYVDVTLGVDVKEANVTFVAPDPAPDEQGVQVKNIPETIAQDDRTPAEGEAPLADTAGSFTIPAVNYASGAMTWQSGLPGGTALTVTVASKSATGASVASEAVKVVSVEAYMVVTYAAGAGMNAFLDGDPYGGGRVLLDKAGTVTIAPMAESAEMVGADDWVVLTVGNNTYYYNTVADTLNGVAKPAADGTLTLTMNQLKALAGASGSEGAWFSANPASSLTVKAVLLDNVDHITGSASLAAAYDTGAAEDTPLSVGNRDTSIAINVADRVASLTVEGQFGGSTPAIEIKQINADGSTDLDWSNISSWMASPENLPHSGSAIEITYTDLVGNVGTQTLEVHSSAAVKPNTIFVQPITDGTVPDKALRFYGDTTAWEACTLNIGDSQFPIEPLPGNESYESENVKQWQQIVTLSDINFPVGVPTVVSIAYDDLSGGEATIEITYKDEAQTPVMGSEAVAGSELLWGYVESGASVSASVYHVDGSVTQIPQSSIAVDQFGYYCIRLGQALASGERVVISTSDFCGNLKSITLDVQDELAPDAKAELLGASVVGEIQEDHTTYHRFATPVDLAALAASETKSMTLPILAYKGIEIGTMTFTLDEQDLLQMDYDIKAISYIPDDAKAYLGTFESKPTIEALVKESLPVAVEELKANPSGSLTGLNVSAYKNEDGEYSGVIWLQAQFDIDMGVDSYVSRGSRDTRFYRWLTESLQTEDVLGAVYQETSAYNENVTYYGIYQGFENISRHS